MSEDQKNQKKAFGVAMALGFELLSLVLIGVFLGYAIGERYGFKELGAIIGCTGAFSLWIWRIVRTQRHLL